MSDRSITEAIQQLAGTQLSDNITIISAIVTSVDQSTRTCECMPIGQSSTPIIGVRLMADIDDGFLLIPALNSTVMITYSTRNTPYIAVYSELQSALWVTIDAIQLQGNEYGGLVMGNPLLQKLNTIALAINSLITFTGSPTAPIQPSIITEITNERVKHGF